ARRHIADPDLRQAQERLRAADSLPQHILVRRRAGGLPERTNEGIDVHADDRRKLAEAEVLLEAGLDVLLDRAQLARRQSTALLLASAFTAVLAAEVDDERGRESLRVDPVDPVFRAKLSAEREQEARDQRVRFAERRSQAGR